MELMGCFKELPERYSSLQHTLVKLSALLDVEKAKEYLFHGVMRRLSVLKRCTENVLGIFPVTRENKLATVELKDVDINIQAFVLNVFGVLDNLAWIFIYHRGLEEKVDKKQVGIFREETKKHFTSEFNDYLIEVKHWYFDYLLSFRDSLVHRIPLYVPPISLTPAEAERVREIQEKESEAMKKGDFDTAGRLFEEATNIGVLSPHFCHSYSEAMTPQNLHWHLISDFRTLEEVIKRYVIMFGVVKNEKLS